MSKYFDPNNYTLENQLSDTLRYGDVLTDDDGTIMKDHDDYVEIIIPAKNDKGHITYDYYGDGHYEPHRNN